MADQTRPTDKEQAQDPSNSYERSHPQNEAGMGRLDNNKSTPTDRPDRPEQASKNRQAPRQVNAQDLADDRASARNRDKPGEQPDHSMFEEEPDGWDMAPTDIHDPRQKRHPRTEGRGGTP